jgi:hypothetical protein
VAGDENGFVASTTNIGSRTARSAGALGTGSLADRRTPQLIEVGSGSEDRHRAVTFVGYRGGVDALPGALRELTLYGLVVLAFLGQIEAFLQFRLRRAARHGDPHGYLALSDPWVTAVVALAGGAAVTLIAALA